MTRLITEAIDKGAERYGEGNPVYVQFGRGESIGTDRGQSDRGEVYMKASLTNPRFKRQITYGETFAIVGARPPGDRAPPLPNPAEEGQGAMKFIVALLALLVSDAALAQVQNRTYQDSMGRNTGRSVTDSRGNTTFYDSMGRNTGRSVTNGNTHHRL